MTYAEIIEQNCRMVTPSWWPRFAYHFTDVTNAVSILCLGRLYSRVRADEKGVMGNDNASRQVIDMTVSRARSFVRFYFRPLTPTQYYNEGYKHQLIRYNGDSYANVPVPIFFLFDLEKILAIDGTCFSAKTQAGHGNPPMQGIEMFSQLPFDKIYSDGPASSDVLSYRHAEILYPDEFAISDTLKFILCRNACEKATLLNMLKSKSLKEYYKYKDRVRIARNHTFQQNGFFVESVVYHEHTISFTFAETPDQQRYIERNGFKHINELKMRARFYFDWKNARRIVCSSFQEVTMDYLKTRAVVFKLPEVPNAHILTVTLEIEGSILCEFEQPLSMYELV